MIDFFFGWITKPIIGYTVVDCLVAIVEIIAVIFLTVAFIDFWQRMRK